MLKQYLFRLVVWVLCLTSNPLISEVGWFNFQNYPFVYSLNERRWFLISELNEDGLKNLYADASNATLAGKGWVYLRNYPFYYDAATRSWGYFWSQSGSLGMQDPVTGDLREFSLPGAAGRTYTSFSRYAFKDTNFPLIPDRRLYDSDCSPRFSGATISTRYAPGAPYGREYLGQVFEDIGILHNFVLAGPYSRATTDLGATVSFVPYGSEYGILYINDDEACGTAIRMNCLQGRALSPQAKLFGEIALLRINGDFKDSRLQILPADTILNNVNADSFDFPIRWSYADLDGYIPSATLSYDVERGPRGTILLYVPDGNNYPRNPGRTSDPFFGYIGDYNYSPIAWGDDARSIPLWLDEVLDVNVVGLSVIRNVPFIQTGPINESNPLGRDRRRAEVRLEMTVTDNDGRTDTVRTNLWGAPPYTNIDLNQYEAPGEAGSYKFFVYANTPWTIGGLPPWVSVQPSSGLEDAEITVTLSQNTSGGSRQANLSVGRFASHHIIQEAGAGIGLSVNLLGKWQILVSAELCPDTAEVESYRHNITTEGGFYFITGLTTIYRQLFECQIEEFEGIPTTEQLEITKSTFTESELVPLFDPDDPSTMVTVDVISVDEFLVTYTYMDVDGPYEEYERWKRLP